ncbi:MAG: heptaprenyl diphosphate synthase component 1 [Bacillus sp. (in: firmicutes)]
MANTQEMVDKVREEIFKKISHAYLFQHIPKPYVDEDKLLLTVAALNDSKLSDKEVEIYAMTTMLIQIALDTHELVTNNSISGEIEKNRQLTVLAGDYYSGHYYKLLADVGDITMIKIFAEAIKEINEHKIILYQQSAGNLKQLLNSIEIVEFSLLNKLLTRFELEEWKEYSRHILVINRLLREKNTYLQTGKSIVLERMSLEKKNAKASRKSTILHNLENTLLSAENQLAKAVEMLPKSISSILKEKVQRILSECKQLQLYAEEG